MPRSYSRSRSRSSCFIKPQFKPIPGFKVFKHFNPRHNLPVKYSYSPRQRMMIHWIPNAKERCFSGTHLQLINIIVKTKYTSHLSVSTWGDVIFRETFGWPPEFYSEIFGIMHHVGPRSTTKLINMHEAHYLGTCHWPLGGCAQSTFLSIVTTSYQTPCTSLWRLLQ